MLKVRVLLQRHITLILENILRQTRCSCGKLFHRGKQWVNINGSNLCEKFPPESKWESRTLPLCARWMIQKSVKKSGKGENAFNVLINYWSHHNPAPCCCSSHMKPTYGSVLKQTVVRPPPLPPTSPARYWCHTIHHLPLRVDEGMNSPAGVSSGRSPDTLPALLSPAQCPRGGFN